MAKMRLKPSGKKGSFQLYRGESPLFEPFDAATKLSVLEKVLVRFGHNVHTKAVELILREPALQGRQTASAA